MAKFKPAGTRKPKIERSSKGMFPCIFFLVAGFAVVFFLFYELLKSGQ
jgi:hypothetical protein